MVNHIFVKTNKEKGVWKCEYVKKHRRKLEK